MLYLPVLATGILSVAWWPFLPNFQWLAAGLLCCLIGHRLLLFRLLACLLAGALWGVCSAHTLIKHQLPENLDKHDIQLTGTINSLVDSTDKRSRFTFVIDSAFALTSPSEPLSITKVLLSWYGAPTLKPGEKWQLTARLSRPRGFSNPGGFNYRGWLLQQAYSATGYVRISLREPGLIGEEFSSHSLRDSIGQTIERQKLDPRTDAVLRALVIGDRTPLGSWWDQLARLGIVHLMVISGLHIGLVAGFGFGLGKLFARLTLPFSQSAGMRFIPALLAMLLAVAYSLLAGFSLPTQRALIAVCVVMTARLLRRNLGPWVCFSWAALLIAIRDPLAGLSSGFWLSFAAVAVLIWWFSPRQFVTRRARWRHMISAQFVLLAGLCVPLLFLLGRVSWLSPFVNLIAVPWVSLVCIPISLLATALSLAVGQAADGLWRLAGGSVSALFLVLDQLPDRAGFIVSPVPLSAAMLGAMALAILSLLVPMPRRIRLLCLIPLLLNLVATKPQAPLRVTILDVGQGLAVVIETPRHRLVYDTGSRFTDSFSAGRNIIAPYLWSRGISAIDTVILSHEDGDHTGGYQGLEQAMPIRKTLVGPALVGESHRFESCTDAGAWSWDGVEFRIVSARDGVDHGNDSSCVLLIRWRDVSVLIPGDIEQWGEYRLLETNNFDQALDLLIAPHHGSRTSSTPQFVDALRPHHVVFSAGFRHAFGHPHPQVVERYRRTGSNLWNTADRGALIFEWGATGRLQVLPQRDYFANWWN